MTHTPAPWFVEGERIRKHCMKDGLITIAKVEGWLSDEYIDEEIANRNLIATAPELLEALEDLVALNGEWSNDAYAKAEAAIKKAKKPTVTSVFD